MFGIEGDIGFGEIDGKGRSATLGDGSHFRVSDFDIEPVGHVRGRIGWTGLSPNLLLFAAGGLAVAEGDIRVLRINAAGDRIPGGGGADDNIHLGFTVGGGVDWRLTPRLVARVEYLFDSYGSENYKLKAAGTTAKVEIDQLHTVRGALIWKF